MDVRRKLPVAHRRRWYRWCATAVASTGFIWACFRKAPSKWGEDGGDGPDGRPVGAFY
ncbi:hypothetical protein BDDG_12436 [Blastomyces dermatitidis ATCC 18188]|uniref:Uncharacterized protein n=1 Tax=Ajellomyces dermatitidis (strain ATCC 18188 / CBS 674.68) TaxID=653446 RepID=A0A0J9ENS0_AJEDA|nr:hypothetical protein BDDG_12436 [Blastomyces dermatitidis ATCC 18188]